MLLPHTRLIYGLTSPIQCPSVAAQSLPCFPIDDALPVRPIENFEFEEAEREGHNFFAGFQLREVE